MINRNIIYYTHTCLIFDCFILSGVGTKERVPKNLVIKPQIFVQCLERGYHRQAFQVLYHSS